MKDSAITVVIPVSRRSDGLAHIVELVTQGLGAAASRAEFLLSVDGDMPERLEEAQAVAASRTDTRVVALARNFGEGYALRAGIEEATCPLVLTHPAYFQVEGAVLETLVQQVEEGADLAFAARVAKREALVNRLQRWAFNAMVRRAVWVRFRDISSSVSVLRREALRELAVHEFSHRFLPVLAVMRGFDVREIAAPVHAEARRSRVYGPGVYVRRILDILNVFFLLRFLFKPLRFFGLIGGAVFGVGALICSYLAVIRLFGGEAIGQRPLFLLGVLMVALGFQTLAVGLLGEMITFTHASRFKPYSVREVTRKVPTAEGEPARRKTEEATE